MGGWLAGWLGLLQGAGCWLLAAASMLAGGAACLTAFLVVCFLAWMVTRLPPRCVGAGRGQDITKGRRRDQGAVKISCMRQDPNARNCHGYRKFVKKSVLEDPQVRCAVLSWLRYCRRCVGAEAASGWGRKKPPGGGVWGSTPAAASAPGGVRGVPVCWSKAVRSTRLLDSTGGMKAPVVVARCGDQLLGRAPHPRCALAPGPCPSPPLVQRGLLVNDTIVIRYQIELVVSTGGALSRGHTGKHVPQIFVPPPSLGPELGTLLESGTGSDVTFQVEDESMAAHKIILQVGGLVRRECMGTRAQRAEQHGGARVAWPEQVPPVPCPLSASLLCCALADSSPAALSVRCPHLPTPTRRRGHRCSARC